MSERCVPKSGERFFAIFSDGKVLDVEYGDAAYKKDLIAIGNCFKTREEAEAAVPKFKEFFANLHKYVEPAPAENKAEESHDHLKKLTPEVFYRPDCPSWAKFAAVNGRGCLMFFESYPERTSFHEDYWRADGEVIAVANGYDATGWVDSIIRSPNIPELPEWCVKDELLYDHNEQEYARIDYVDTKQCKVTLVYRNNIEPELRSFAYINDCCQHARIRPFNPEELKELVGECLEDEGDRDLVTSYDGDSEEVYVYNAWWSADDLLEHGYTLYAGPCGVFETVDGETHPKSRTYEQ